MKYTKLVVSTALVFFISFKDAFAYLDPGTGSILIQGLIAAIAGGLFTIRLYWQKVKGLFRKETEKNDDGTSNSDLDKKTTLND